VKRIMTVNNTSTRRITYVQHYR